MKRPLPLLAFAGAGIFALALALFLFLQQKLTPSIPPTLTLESATPAEWSAGSPLEMAITGHGFDERTRVALVSSSPSPDPEEFSFPIWGSLRHLTLDGNLVYVANHNRGIQVVDLSAPGGPKLLCSYKTTNRPWGMVADKGFIYVADQFAGLLIADVSNPGRIQPVGSVRLHGYATDVAVEGSTAYVANTRLGLQAVDVRNPRQPELISTLQVPGVAYNVEVRNGYAYLAALRGGLQIVDVRDPGRMRLVAQVQGPANLAGIALAADLLYAVGKGGLATIDISDPERPRQLSLLPEINGSDLALGGGQAMVISVKRMLFRVDLKNPRRPRLIELIPMSQQTHGIVFDRAAQRFLLSADDKGIITLGLHPKLPGLTPPAFAKLPKINDMVVREGIVYLITPDREFLLVDIRGEAPQVLATCPTLEPGIRLSVADGVAAIGQQADGSTDLPEITEFFDIRDPGNPRRIGVLKIRNTTHMSFAKEGARLYIGDMGGEIKIYSVAGSQELKQLGKLAIPGKIRGIAVRDGLLYVGGGDGSLRIFPADAPGGKAIGEISFPWHLHNPLLGGMLLLRGNRAYLAAGMNGLLIYDISDTKKPRLVSALPNERATGITIDGRFLYITNHQEDVRIYELADGDRPPSPVAVMPVSLISQAVETDSHRVFYVDTNQRLQVLSPPAPASRIEVESGERLHAVFPPPPTVGTYILEAFNENRIAILKSTIRIAADNGPN